MDETVTTLTVLFEPPFWIGLFERECNGEYSVCKYTFGPQPKDYEVYEVVLHRLSGLSFSPPVQAAVAERYRINPKRMQREAQRAMETAGIGTKAQQALKLQHEQGKLARRVKSKEEREAEAERKFQLRQEKNREKHRGH